MTREKYMSSAQLTAKCLEEKNAATRILSLLADFSLRAGLRPDSVGFEAFTRSMEGVFECVTNMLSRLADYRRGVDSSTDIVMGATERRLYPYRYDRNSLGVSNKSSSNKEGDVDLLRISILSKSLERMGSGLESQLGIDPLTPMTPIQSKSLVQPTATAASTEHVVHGSCRIHQPAVHIPSSHSEARGNDMSSSEFVRYLKLRRREQNNADKSADFSILTGYNEH
jgi:hypothetical protein